MLIRSTSNPHIKYIRTLCEKRKARNTRHEFFVEGVRAVSEAFSHGWNVKKLIYCPSLVRSDWAKKIVAESDPFIQLQISETLHNKLCDRNDLELMAIISQVGDDFDRIPIPIESSCRRSGKSAESREFGDNHPIRRRNGRTRSIDN